jgi:Spy/CpxP family protein refolding chaperone
MKKIMLFTVILLIVFPLSIFARGGHHGKSDLPYGKWWRIPEIAEKFNLTDEEQTKLDDLYVQNRKKLIDLKSNVEKEMLALQQKMDDKNSDVEACVEQFKKVQKARTELATERFRYLVEVRSILGFERFQGLKKSFSEHRKKRIKRYKDSRKDFLKEGLYSKDSQKLKKSQRKKSYL